MNHLAVINSEFFKIAVDRDWWKNLPKEEQQQYILKHRRTKLRPTTGVTEGNQQIMSRILRSIPQEWKKTLISNGVGKNSSTEQLPDALRPRIMKKIFDDDSSTQALVAFKAGTPITDMQPEFIITRLSYDTEKFNCKRYKDSDGNVLTGFDANVFETKSRPSTWDRRLRRVVQRPPFKQTDLRMSKIVDKLPDQAYTVFAIKSDETKSQLRSMRRDDSSTHRTIVNQLIAKEVKPVYDYYSDKMNSLIGELSTTAIPEFSEIVNASRYSSIMKDTTEITKEIERVREKLSSIIYSISRVKNIDLPPRDKSYSRENKVDDRVKEHVHELFEEIKKVKKKYEDDFFRAERFKKSQAINAIKNNDVQGSIDALNDIRFTEIAKRIKKLSDEGKLSDEKENLISEIQQTSKV